LVGPSAGSPSSGGARLNYGIDIPSDYIFNLGNQGVNLVDECRVRWDNLIFFSLSLSPSDFMNSICGIGQWIKDTGQETGIYNNETVNIVIGISVVKLPSGTDVESFYKMFTFEGSVSLEKINVSGYPALMLTERYAHENTDARRDTVNYDKRIFVVRDQEGWIVDWDPSAVVIDFEEVIIEEYNSEGDKILASFKLR
jgi:hypothetical protein